MNGKGTQTLFANCIQYCVRKAYNQLFKLPLHTIFVCKLQTNFMLFPNNFLREYSSSPGNFKPVAETSCIYFCGLIIENSPGFIMII